MKRAFILPILVHIATANFRLVALFYRFGIFNSAEAKMQCRSELHYEADRPGNGAFMFGALDAESHRRIKMEKCNGF